MTVILFPDLFVALLITGWLCILIELSLPENNGLEQ